MRERWGKREGPGEELGERIWERKEERWRRRERRWKGGGVCRRRKKERGYKRESAE